MLWPHGTSIGAMVELTVLWCVRMHYGADCPRRQHYGWYTARGDTLSTDLHRQLIGNFDGAILDPIALGFFEHQYACFSRRRDAASACNMLYPPTLGHLYRRCAVSLDFMLLPSADRICRVCQEHVGLDCEKCPLCLRRVSVSGSPDEP